ncbi:hypothetical protein CesoFtcFv8_011834 [Champsocephalus esox]|uniref:Uncharacterized protein n=1 Tax=Champsocephalus esox TaxID=159716 RepID=A0AAN8GXN7_9TELE|nr:hypothetical protein CesoFtcFv8_011834 [Champsocephalus esox]
MLRPLLLKLQSTLKQLKVWSCMKRTCKAKSEEPEPPVETQHDFVTETDREYDDIGEADRSRSRPVEISSVHTHARYTRPNADETDDYYNIDTASNS